MRNHEERPAATPFFALVLVVFTLGALNPCLARNASAKELTIAAFQVTYNHAGHQLLHYEKDFFKKLRTMGNVKVLEGAALREFMEKNMSQPSVYHWLNLLDKGYIEPFREFRAKGIDRVIAFIMTAMEQSLIVEVYEIDTIRLKAAKFKDVEYLYPGDRRSLAGFHNVYQSIKKKFYGYFEEELSRAGGPAR